jgi:glycerol-3-phosphate acyltransferase PlsX
MRIALDARGGKHAPLAIVEGAALAIQRRPDLQFLFVGDAEALSPLITQSGLKASAVGIQSCSEAIEDAESPIEALKAKPAASIVMALEAHERGEADAVVSAGNSGAQIVASIEILGELEGVKRPAIGSYFPTQDGRIFVIDVGANVSCRAIHLLQFAVMGALFRKHLDGLQIPRVALLSNGEESTKGSHPIKEAHELMSLVPGFNFIGNIEGRQIYTGQADVVVTDGFTGNVLLKFAESIPDILAQCARKTGLAAGPTAELEALLRSFDYQEFGGAPLLGVNGVSIVCHGRSTSKAIASAIGEAVKMVQLQVNQSIREQIHTMGQWSATVKTKALIGRWRRRSTGDER